VKSAVSSFRALLLGLGIAIQACGAAPQAGPGGLASWEVEPAGFVDFLTGDARAGSIVWPYSRELNEYWSVQALGSALDLGRIALGSEAGVPGQELGLSGIPIGAGKIRVFVSYGTKTVQAFIRRADATGIRVVIPALPGMSSATAVTLAVTVRGVRSPDLAFRIDPPPTEPGEALRMVGVASGSISAFEAGAGFVSAFFADATGDHSIASQLGGDATDALDTETRTLLDKITASTGLVGSLEAFHDEVVNGAQRTVSALITSSLLAEKIRRGRRSRAAQADGPMKKAAAAIASLSTIQDERHRRAAAALVRGLTGLAIAYQLLDAGLPDHLNGIELQSAIVAIDPSGPSATGRLQVTGSAISPGLVVDPTALRKRLVEATAELALTAGQIDNTVSAAINGMRRTGAREEGGKQVLAPETLQADVTTSTTFESLSSFLSVSGTDSFHISLPGCAKVAGATSGFEGGDATGDALIYLRGRSFTITWTNSYGQVVPGPSDARVTVAGQILPGFTGRVHWDGRDGGGKYAPAGTYTAFLYGNGQDQGSFSFSIGCNLSGQFANQSLPRSSARPGSLLGEISP